MSDDIVRTQRAHPLRAETVSAYWSSPFGILRRRRRMDMFSRHLAGIGNILEIGCGAGEFSEAFPATATRLVSGDLIPHMARAATLSGRAQPGRVLVLDAHRLPFPDNSFSGAFGNSVLHHLDISSALRELHRVLKPGSPVIFSEPNMCNPMVWLIRNVGVIGRLAGETPGETAYSRTQFHKLTQDAGFKDVTVRNYDFCIGPQFLLPTIRKVEPALESGCLKSMSLSLLMTARA